MNQWLIGHRFMCKSDYRLLRCLCEHKKGDVGMLFPLIVYQWAVGLVELRSNIKHRLGQLEGLVSSVGEITITI